MGSGKLLQRAIDKYGIENFEKEILFVFDNEQEMNDKEKELVVVSEETYNLCEGGKGGFGYINKNKLNYNHIFTPAETLKGNLQRMQFADCLNCNKQFVKNANRTTFCSRSCRTSFINRGKQRSEETKQKLRQANLGKKLSEETKLKISLTNKNQIPWNKGKTWNKNI